MTVNNIPTVFTDYYYYYKWKD